METSKNPEPPETDAQPVDAGDAPDERLGHSPFPIVGIGASAGGLEAFTQLLGHLPEQTGMAFLLVQHLDPKVESQLTALLSKVTQIPVLEATHGLAVRPDHIYVILEFCKLRRDCVKSRVRWIISRGPPRSRPDKGSDNSSAWDDHPKR